MEGMNRNCSFAVLRWEPKRREQARGIAPKLAISAKKDDFTNFLEFFLLVNRQSMFGLHTHLTLES